MAFDPVSGALTALSGLAGVFGSSAAADAKYQAEAEAIQAENDARVLEYNNVLMDIGTENYGLFTDRVTGLIDYDYALQNEFSAAMRASADNELVTQGAMDELKKAEEKLYVEKVASKTANEGGTTNAKNVNVERAAGREAGLMAATRKKLVADQYGANVQIAQEASNNLQRAHDLVFTEVVYNTLLPDEPTLLDAPAAPSAWDEIAGLFGVATSTWNALDVDTSGWLKNSSGESEGTN